MLRARDYRAILARVLAPAMLALFPLCVLVLVLLTEFRGPDFAYDFHHELYRQASEVLHGRSPYPPPNADLSSGKNMIWPMAAVLPVVPLALLPAKAAAAVMTAAVLAAFAGTLFVLDVRDWRVYGAALLWPPVINAVQTANLTLPLCLLVALGWRFRRRAGIPGTVIGAALALKFVLGPLVVWLAAIRRFREAALALLLGAASLLLLVPFTSLRDYAHLMRRLSSTFEDDAYTPYALLAGVGAGHGVAHAVGVVVGLATLALAWRWHSLALAIGAAFALSPIVWLHYFALLLMPFAAVSPTFGAIWFVPLLMWFAPGTLNGSNWQCAQVLAAAAIAIAWCARLETHSTPRRHEAAVRTARTAAT